MFLESHGYEIKKNVPFRDNQIIIIMENNTRDACTVNSRHINIRNFFVKGRVDKIEIDVNYFPIHLVIADYF